MVTMDLQGTVCCTHSMPNLICISKKNVLLSRQMEMDLKYVHLLPDQQIKHHIQVLLWLKYSGTSLFPSDFKSVFVWHLTGKILSSDFYSKAVFFSASLGFHSPPLFTFKTAQLDFRVGSRRRWRQRLTNSKLQRVNAAHCTCKIRV